MRRRGETNEPLEWCFGGALRRFWRRISREIESGCPVISEVPSIRTLWNIEISEINSTVE